MLGAPGVPGALRGPRLPGAPGDCAGMGDPLPGGIGGGTGNPKGGKSLPGTPPPIGERASSIVRIRPRWGLSDCLLPPTLLLLLLSEPSLLRF